MKFKAPLLQGTIVRRYRRSLADVRLSNGKVVTVHSPGLGPMTGAYEPGSPVLLSDSQDTSRKHGLTWELISINGIWIGINPVVARKVLQESIEGGIFPSLASYQIQRETRYGLHNRADLILQGMENNCFINVYSVSWVEQEEAFFPDARNDRICNQIRSLSEVAINGHRAMVFILVQRGDARQLRFAEKVDPQIMDAIRKAHDKGVELIAFSARVSPEEICLGNQLTVVFEDSREDRQTETGPV